MPVVPRLQTQWTIQVAGFRLAIGERELKPPGDGCATLAWIQPLSLDSGYAEAFAARLGLLAKLVMLGA